ncbi:MAG: DUF6152 family protein [Pseudomonadota bacterium]|nr:DUF6152 family protein [Pseudomonadota bacterium]
MKNLRLLLITIALAFYLVGTAWAHHSRGNFDLENTVELQGTVTEFTWRNPHVFATLAVDNEEGVAEEWLLELNSISVLTGTGWNRDTLNVGDKVTVVGNLEKDHTSNFLFSNYFVLPDASRMVSAPNFSRGIPIARPPAREIDTNARSENFSGIWRQQGTGMGMGMGMAPAISLGNQTPARGLPLTALGQAELAAFDVRDNPWFRCEARGLPSVFNGTQEIAWQNEQKIIIRYQLLDIQRIVHLDITEHPTQVARSRLGHSIGWFEDETLVIDTAFFEPVEWGIGAGVSSSEEKHVVERYSLVHDGSGLQLDLMFEDPVYMTEPTKLASTFFLDTGYQWQEYNCDPNASSRHLDFK